MAEFQCSICKLHYRNRGLSEGCYKWCSKHDSCNLKVASQSIEALESRKRLK